MTTYRADTRHGAVVNPPSRGSIYLEPWQANGLEAGKFFPLAGSGLTDPHAPTDVPNAVPPPDGKLASAGQAFAAVLDEPRDDWFKHSVTPGQVLEVSWGFHAPHKTRRFNYFLTRPDWDPGEVLSRAQFDERPFEVVELTCQPFWGCDDLVPPNPVMHPLRLPERDGYHVLLAVWEVADTGNAFYQVVDVDFGR
jgi:chitin-binding protein